MKVIVKGDAVARKETGGLIRGSALREYDGVEDDAVFSDFFHKASPHMAGKQQQSLIDAGVTGGVLVFKHEGSKLYATTEYTVPRKLTAAEEKVLIDYTTGQWSDGIGEGFEQWPVNGAYLSAWHVGQEVSVSYAE